MTTSSLIQGQPEPFDRAGFNDDRIEATDEVVRRQLDLRPAHYLAGGDKPDTHPDRRPCPSWCWVGQNSDEYDHEVVHDHPLDATHTMDAFPHVVASLYPGRVGRGSDRVVSAGTIEPRLEQVGQQDAQVRVGFRKFDGDEQEYIHDFLRLSLTDARELVLALNYLVDLAE